MANVNTYINAGNNAAQAAVNIRQDLANNNPRYDQQAMTAIQEQAKTRATRISNKAKERITKEKADTSVELAKIEVDRDNALRNDKRQARMAGMLAGGVGMIGGSFALKNKKDEPNAQLAQMQQMQSFWSDQIAKTQSEIAALNQKSVPSTATNEDGTPKETAQVPSATAPTSGDGQSSPWLKLGNTIAFGEGTTGPNGYNTQFTGTQFSGFKDHPRQLRTGGGYTSDASGKYQFLSTTWDSAAKALGLTDFTPESQEKAGRFLAQQRGVDPDAPITTIEQFRTVMDKLAPEWASLPTASTGTSYYGQGGKSLDALWQFYQSQ